MLCIDLAGPSTLIEGNRAKKTPTSPAGDTGASTDEVVEEAGSPATA